MKYVAMTCLCLLILLLLATLVVQSQTVGQPDLSASLLQGQLGWWKGVPGFTMTTRLYDLLGRMHCTLTNMGTLGTTSGWSPTTRQGGFMQLNLDGSNDVVDCGSDPLVDDVPLKSVALWVRLTNYGGTNNIRLVDKRNAGGWMFGVNNAQVTAGLNFIQDTDAGPGNWALTNRASLNTWVHIGFTFDRTAVLGTPPTFFVNGEAFAPDVTINPPDGTGYGSDAASTLALGAEDLGAGKQFPGALDDVRLWGRILSAAEMRAVYQQSLLGDPGLFRAPAAVAAITTVTPSQPPGSFFPFFR